VADFLQRGSRKFMVETSTILLNTNAAHSRRKMAKHRVKKRTHAGTSQNGTAAVLRTERAPKSMVIRIGAGEVGQSVSQLAKDVRQVMEPGTASRLKERKTNRLKDYMVMAGPLGVTHLLLFSRSPSGNTNLRLAVTPRGPTLHFRVENYSLCKDILKAQRHPKASSSLHLTPPLVSAEGPLQAIALTPA
jgi:ribosome biogenesis protein SSF1/2